MLDLMLALALAATPAKPATNLTCPVLGFKVDAKSPVVAVRGRNYRICCPGCDQKLLADPAKYLKRDGTPKKAPGKALAMPSRT